MVNAEIFGKFLEKIAFVAKNNQSINQYGKCRVKHRILEKKCFRQRT